MSYLKEEWMVWADRLARWFLAFVFLAAGIPKLLDPLSFARIIDAYGILPEIFVFPTALIVVLVELLAAAALLAKRVEGLAAVSVMLLGFMGVLSYGIWMGLDIDCGCFGPEDAEYTAFSGLRTALLRDVMFCLPLLYCWWYHFKLRSDKQERNS